MAGTEKYRGTPTWSPSDDEILAVEKREKASADWPPIYDRVKDALRDGNCDAETLVDCFWKLEQAASKSFSYIVVSKLMRLQHRVMERMSACLPTRPVELEHVVEEENKTLCPARLHDVRQHGGAPIVVSGRPEDVKVKLRDGHHRVAIAKEDGCKQLLAVWIEPRNRSSSEE